MLTEHAAYGIAISALSELTQWQQFMSAPKKTGFDFWLPDASGQLKARLEVSGILSGTEARITERVHEKILQVRRYDWNCPAYVAVVEFGKPTLKVVIDAGS